MYFDCQRWIKKTRKTHVCIWCGTMIEAGSAAWYGCGYREDFWSGHMHPECAAAKDAVGQEYGEWEANGEYARGRKDDRFLQPPEFPDTYRGKTRGAA
jgi:hypothetical protein